MEQEAEQHSSLQGGMSAWELQQIAHRRQAAEEDIAGYCARELRHQAELNSETTAVRRAAGGANVLEGSRKSPRLFRPVKRLAQEQAEAAKGWLPVRKAKRPKDEKEWAEWEQVLFENEGVRDDLTIGVLVEEAEMNRERARMHAR